MQVEKILKVKLDEKVLDRLDLFLIDRFADLDRKRTEEQSQDDKELWSRLEDLVMGRFSDDKKKNADFLSKIADRESESQEDFYLLGIRDGIKFMKTVCMI